MARIIRVRYGNFESYMVAENDAEIKELRRLLRRMINKRITIVTLVDGTHQTISAAMRINDLQRWELFAQRRDRMEALRRNRHVLLAIATCNRETTCH